MFSGGPRGHRRAGSTRGATVWPFGVHGNQGHTEGHPGIDFISSTSARVFAAADGTVSRIEPNATNGEYVDGATSVYVRADCGITCDYQPLLAVPGLKVGARVTRGQLLGTMAEMLSPNGPGRFAFRFDTRAHRPDGTVPWGSFCAGQSMSAEDSAALLARVDAVSHPEKTSGPVLVPCADGGRTDFTFPAEDRLCNAHLEEPAASALAACLQLGSGRPVW